jgi:hypothetical protein
MASSSGQQRFLREHAALIALRDSACEAMVRDWKELDSTTSYEDLQSLEGLELDSASRKIVGLDLSGEEGIGDISALAKLKYLTQLNLTGCWRVDNGTYDIIYNDSERETVEPEMIRMLTSRDNQTRPETNDVVEVNYKAKGEYFCGRVARRRLGGVAPIAECANLQYLDISGTAISDLTRLFEAPFNVDEPRALLPHLRKLKVGRTKLALGMVANLGRIDWLEVISKAWAASLHTLDLQYTSVEVLNTLASNSKHLSSLCLAGCNSLKLNITTANLFQVLLRLQVLNLSSVKIVDYEVLQLICDAAEGARETVIKSAAAAAIALVAAITAAASAGAAAAATRLATARRKTPPASLRHPPITLASSISVAITTTEAFAYAIETSMAAVAAATTAAQVATIAACAPGVTSLNLSHCEKVL